MDINEARKEINDLDRQMAELFVRRMEAARAIAAFKKERGLPIEDKAQEEKVIQDHLPLIQEEELAPFYAQFLQDTMDVSKRWQHRLIHGMSVAYCGVEGAFAHVAARRIFPDAETVPFASFEDAYEAVSSGKCDVTVLPIENSYAGEVGQVLDLMLSGPLHVNGVYDLSIVQNLLGTGNADLSMIKTVISHPQALTQCQNYIRRHGFSIRSAANTAMAAQEAARLNDDTVAAIASEETAALYGLKILDHDINESKANTTRFAVFSPVENRLSGHRQGDAFILLFTVKDEAGGLAKALNIISAYNFNLRVLRSRPMKDLAWHYYFYAEAEGDDGSENGRQMIRALSGVCPMVKVAGRYFASALQPAE